MAHVVSGKIGSSTFDGSNTPITGALDVGTGSGRYAFVAVFWRQNQAHTVASVTVGSDSLSSETAINLGGQYNLQSWHGALTVEDSETITVTPANATGTAGDTLILCAVYDDVSAVSGYDTFASADIGAGGSTTLDIVSDTGETVFVVHLCRDASTARAATETGYTQRAEVNSGGSPVFGTTTISAGDATGAALVETEAEWVSSGAGSAGRAYGYSLAPVASGGSAAITGTVGDGITEDDLVSTGGTIVITLTDDTWVSSGATFDAQRQNIIDGLDSAQAEAAGWNAEVRDALAVTAVVRTSDTICTITIPATAGYSVTANETVTVTVPGTALIGASPIVAAPTITVTNSTVGPTLSAYSGVTNGSGVGSLNALSDIVLAGTPGVYRVNITAGGITKRLHIQTE